MKQEASNKITMYNFIMTIAIVLYHYVIDISLKKHWTKGILLGLNHFCKGIGSLAMCVFFLISGFLLYNNANTTKDVLKKMKNRIFTLIIPFFIWNFITFIFRVEFTGLKDFIFGFFCRPYNGAIWYLLGLAFLMLFAPLIIKLKKSKLLCFITFAIVIVLTQLLCQFGHNMHWYKAFTDNVWYFGNILGYLPVYLIGAYAGMFYAKQILNEEYNIVKAKRISIMLFIVTFLILCIRTMPWINIICAISFWFCIESKTFNKKPLEIFNVSFLIYVMHSPFLILWANNIMMTFIGGNTVLPLVKVGCKIVGTFMVWLMAIVVDWVIKNLFGKRIHQALTGGRGK